MLTQEGKREQEKTYKCKDCPHGKEVEQYPKALFCTKIWCWVLKEDNECLDGWKMRREKVNK